MPLAVSLSLRGSITKLDDKLSSFSLAKRFRQKDCQYICEKMYDYWLRAYYDKLDPDEVFPCDDLLDELHAHDPRLREKISRALNQFMADFEEELLKSELIETVLIAGYEAMRINGSAAMLHTARPADNRFVFG